MLDEIILPCSSLNGDSVELIYNLQVDIQKRKSFAIPGLNEM